MVDAARAREHNTGLERLPAAFLHPPFRGRQRIRNRNAAAWGPPPRNSFRPGVVPPTWPASRPPRARLPRARAVRRLLSPASPHPFGAARPARPAISPRRSPPMSRLSRTRGRRLRNLLAIPLVLAALLGAAAHAAAQMTPDQAAELMLNSARKAYNEKNHAFAAARFREFLGRFGGHKQAASARYGLALCLL